MKLRALARGIGIILLYVIAVPFLLFVYFFRVIDKDNYYYQLKMEKEK